jgi:hypothetical protein
MIVAQQRNAAQLATEVPIPYLRKSHRPLVSRTVYARF